MTDKLIAEKIGGLAPGAYGSREILRHFGKYLCESAKAEEAGKSILATAYRKNIPIFCPALNDSSIGIGLARRYAKNRDIIVDAIKDNYEVARIKLAQPLTGAIYLGGGVPKNFIEQLSIQAELLTNDFVEGHEYSAQITTDMPNWGGLSGCTPQEAIAWGKNKATCKRAMAHVDVTIGFPLVVGYLLEKKIERQPHTFAFLDEPQGNT